METQFEKLNIFFDRIKSIGFWQRIFQWHQITSLSYDAYQEFKELVNLLTNINSEKEELKNSIVVYKSDVDHFETENIKLESSSDSLKQKIKDLENDATNSKSLIATNEEKIKSFEKRNSDLENLNKSYKEKFEIAENEITKFNSDIASKDATIKMSDKKIIEEKGEIEILKAKINQIENDLTQVRRENTIFKQTENDRKEKYDREVAAITALREKVEKDRQKEIDDQQQKEIARIQAMKETWSKHQENVKNNIKLICNRQIIEYVDQVPFKGNPDNTLKICDDFVIFDAKSPMSEDLSNFPAYIKAQTESVKKYIKEEGVRKDIFLVIPSNTVDVIEAFNYNMGDYSVYIVTIDVLEPLIMCLKKIEEYEFVNQLSPEERENICRVIGKFAHMTKRRIQIDHFFARYFLDVISKCDTDLPSDILEKVIEFEKSEKMNPPIEKRAKQISTKILEAETEKIKKEATARAIAFPTSIQKDVKAIPLYEGEETANLN